MYRPTGRTATLEFSHENETMDVKETPLLKKIFSHKHLIRGQYVSEKAYSFDTIKVTMYPHTLENMPLGTVHAMAKYGVFNYEIDL